MRRVALIGADGQLGTDISRRFEWTSTIIRLTHDDIDMRDHDRVRSVLDSIGPDVVINTAAFHKVEACEGDIRQALAVNCHAVRNLALVCNDLRALLVHFSTDYVFDGQQTAPYPEDATPSPVNAYGVSKVLGEHYLRGLSQHYLLIRSSGLYGLRGSSGKGGNFVETMLRLGREKGAVSVVRDQVSSPTSTADLATMVHRLVEAGARGLYHVTNSGSCSWHEFATAIFALAGMSVTVIATTAETFGSPVRRPAYSVLENRKLQQHGYGLLRSWPEALHSYLEERARRLATVV